MKSVIPSPERAFIEWGYLHELTDGFAAERVIGQWMRFYNTERPHSALDGATPAEAYSIRPDR